MAYWIAWIVKPFIKDPGRRIVRRRRIEEPPNPELNFTGAPLPDPEPGELPVAPVVPGAQAPDGSLDFGPLPGSLELSRKESYRSARTALTWFWLAIGILFIAPFLVVLLGFIGGFLGSYFVADVPQALIDFTTADQAMSRRYDLAYRQHRDGEIDDAQFANRIEKDVLPPWQAAADRFGAMKYVPAGDRPLVNLVNEYIRLQRESLEETVQALRSGDAQAMEAANRKLEAAAKIADKINDSQR